MHKPALLRSNSQQHPDRFHPSNRGEHFTEIHPMLLDIPLCDEAGLVLDDGTFLITLDFENPLEANSFVPSW